MANLGKKRLNRLINELKEIRRTATMEGALFGFPSDDDGDLTTLIKSETKLWRESWLVSPLDRLIEEFEELAEVSNG